MPNRVRDDALNLAACPCAGVTLDKLIQPAILVVLAKGEMHGYALAERLSAMPLLEGGKPDASGVYRFLKAMERKGLVHSTWDTSHSGPARRIYRITEGGACCLRTWVATLEKYRNGINALLRAARHVANR